MTRRRWWTVIATIAVIALAVAGTVTYVGWRNSVGHRADEIADSFREMPGVTTVEMPDEEDDDPRELTVTMPRSAQRPEVNDVLQRVEDRPEDVIGDVAVRVGRASVEWVAYDSSGGQDVDLLWALRGLHHGSAEVRDNRVVLEEEKHPSVSSVALAHEAFRSLERHGIPRVRLSVGHLSAQDVTVDNDLPVRTARRQLNQLLRVGSSLTTAHLHDNDIELTTKVSGLSRVGALIRAGQRAVGEGEPADKGDPSSVSVRSTNLDLRFFGGTSGDPERAISTVQKVRDQGWDVDSIQLDRKEISVSAESQELSPTDLPGLYRDLAALPDPLPKGAVISVDGSRRPSPSLFRGHASQLKRVGPRLHNLEKLGYLVSWVALEPNYSRQDAEVSVTLPKDVTLGTQAAERLIPRLRSLGWPSAAEVTVRQRGASEGESFPPYLKFTSTATGKTKEVTTFERARPEISPEAFRRQWNATATTSDSPAR